MREEENKIFFHQPMDTKYNSIVTSFNNMQIGNIENMISKNQYLNYTNTFSNRIKTKTLNQTPNNRIIIRKTIDKNCVKLPLLINKNEISSFEKRKRYKINLHEDNENLTFLKKKNHDNDDYINIKKMKKKAYINYFIQKSEKRKKKLNALLDEINKTEDRYNKEKPDVDSDFVSKEKILVDNRWKNSFYLDEYQQFFMRKLKDKISSMNYRQMQKKFRDISIMCFSPGNEHNIPKKINYLE